MRWLRGTYAVLAVMQVLQAAGHWRDAGGPDGRVLVSAAVVVLCVVAAVAVPWPIVRVDDGRIAWELGMKQHDLAFGEVADICPDLRWWGSSLLVTTDGRVRRLPLQPQHGPEVWHLVLGGRSPSPA